MMTRLEVRPRFARLPTVLPSPGRLVDTDPNVPNARLREFERLPACPSVRAGHLPGLDLAEDVAEELADERNEQSPKGRAASRAARRSRRVDGRVNRAHFERSSSWLRAAELSLDCERVTLRVSDRVRSD